VVSLRREDVEDLITKKPEVDLSELAERLRDRRSGGGSCDSF
jgi:hypothetical protein